MAALRAPLLALAILAAGLAGCVAPGTTMPADAGGPSPVLYDLDALLAEHTPIRSFDGTTIDAWVFRPDADEPVPVIINFSPYWSNLAPPAATKGDAYSRFLVDHFVPRGYAVALVSARGTGLSEGCFTIGGPVELKDEDAVATFFGEAGWSNGNVTAVGKSYDGTMAQGLLAMGNPHVRTIVPTSPISELYKYNYFDGVPYPNGFGTNTFNTNYLVTTSFGQTQDPGTFEKTPTRVCQETVDVQVGQYQGSLAGDYSAYWQARNYTALLPERVVASVFYIHGLSDWNVKPDHMVPWIEELRARNVTVKMWLGDWAHDYPHRPDHNETLLRWLDHWLKGKDTGILDEPLVNVQDKDGVWRTEDAWPPARAAPLRFYPATGGKLQAEAGSGTASYVDAPLPELLTAGAGAVYRSEALPDDLRLVGAPTLHVKLSSTGPRATLSATLLVDGKVLDQGFRDLAHVRSMEASEPMQPGQTYDVLVHFFPQDAVIPKGSVLTLVLSHAPPPGAFTDIAAAPTGAQVTLQHGEGTFIDVPVIRADDGAFESPQPEDLGCWAC